MRLTLRGVASSAVGLRMLRIPGGIPENSRDNMPKTNKWCEYLEPKNVCIEARGNQVILKTVTHSIAK